MRTNSLYTCKYQEYISFKPNLKEAYSSFLKIFFDCIRYCRAEREKTKLFNSFLPSKDINMVFSYVLHNYFLILDQFSVMNISAMVRLQPKSLKSLCFFFSKDQFGNIYVIWQQSGKLSKNIIIIGKNILDDFTIVPPQLTAFQFCFSCFYYECFLPTAKTKLGQPIHYRMIEKFSRLLRCSAFHSNYAINLTAKPAEAFNCVLHSLLHFFYFPAVKNRV